MPFIVDPGIGATEFGSMVAPGAGGNVVVCVVDVAPWVMSIPPPLVELAPTVIKLPPDADADAAPDEPDPAAAAAVVADEAAAATVTEMTMGTDAVVPMRPPMRPALNE